MYPTYRIIFSVQRSSLKSLGSTGYLTHLISGNIPFSTADSYSWAKGEKHSSCNFHTTMKWRILGCQTSYPCQGFLYRDHILLHHHHQLDSLFVTHSDFTSHKTNVITCQVKNWKVSWQDLTKLTAFIRQFDKINPECQITKRSACKHISFTCLEIFCYCLNIPFEIWRVTPLCDFRKLCQKDLPFLFPSNFPAEYNDSVPFRGKKLLNSITTKLNNNSSDCTEITNTKLCPYSHYS